MAISKDLTDSILSSVLDRVKGSITPPDDTPDDDESIFGLVKRSLDPGQEKEEGIFGLISNALSTGGDSGSSGGLMDILGSLLGGAAQKETERADSSGGGLMDILGSIMSGGSKEEPEAEQAAKSSGGGLMDALGAILGGVSKAEPASEESSGNGLMDILGSVLGGGRQAASEKDRGLMGMITDAIGGEGVIGDILESVLKSKGVSASNLSADSGLAATIKDFVVDLIAKYVLNKVQANLTGGKSSVGNTLGGLLDALTPDT